MATSATSNLKSLTHPSWLQIPQPEQFTDAADFELKFLTKEEANNIILENGDYLRNFSRLDVCVRMGKESTLEEFIRFYSQQAQDWTHSERDQLIKIINRVKSRLSRFKIKFPKIINFAKTTGKEESDGTEAYCLKRTVVFCKNHFPEDVVIHELFHIHSQVDPESRARLYQLIGFNPCNPITLPPELAKKRIINPDSLFLHAYIEVSYQQQRVKAIPFDMYDEDKPRGNGKTDFMRDVSHRFIAVEGEPDRLDYKKDSEGQPILFEFDECEDFYEQIGNNTNYTDSPEEIIADNFAIMVLDEYCESESVIEKMISLLAKDQSAAVQERQKKTKNKAYLWQSFFDPLFIQLMRDASTPSIKKGLKLFIYEVATGVENAVRLVFYFLAACCQIALKVIHFAIRTLARKKEFTFSPA